MSVSVDRGRVTPGAGAARRQFVECLPVLRESLERERAFRAEQLTRLAAEAADTAGGRQGRAAPRGDDVAALDRARAALTDVERALAAIRAGTYGSCADCADEVPLAVLRSVPQASRCLRCHRLHGDAPPARAAARGSAVDRARAVPPPPAQAVVWVRRLLGRPVLGPQRQHLGHVRDVVAHRLPDAVGTVVTGLIVDAGGHRWFAPATAIRDLQAGRVVLREFSIRPAGCRLPTEHLLARDSLGRAVMTDPDGPPARISDIALRRVPAGWRVSAADTRTTVRRLLGSPRGLVEWDALATRRFATPTGSPADS